MAITMTKNQMELFLEEIVENFNGEEFNIEDIKKLSTYKKPKKSKKVKDPKAPKGACSAWIHFTSEMRKKTSEENPDKKNTEITTIMSVMWRNYTDEEKQPYKEKEDVDRKRYKQEKEEYESGSDVEEPGENKKMEEKKKKKVKDPDAPKRNIGAMQHFCKVYRAKNEGTKFTMDFLKNQWNDLEDKTEYEEMAKKDKGRYMKEKKEYEEKNN
jgi:hypothetical protein